MQLFIIDHFGLAKPYRFERTLVILFALLVAGATGLAAAYCFRIGGFAEGKVRVGYFVYLAILPALAVMLARWPRLAALVLSLAALDLGLGMGSAILFRHGIGVGDLLPKNDGPTGLWAWHPLLQVVVRPGATHTIPAGEIRHNSLGQRGPERSPEALRDKTVVALFGGSTTEDIGSADGHTWGEDLEKLLGGDRFAVINHAVSWYSTAQIIVQTAFYQDAFGVPPACAVYYVGGVDVQNSHIEGLDPGYADYHTPALIDAFRVRRLEGAIGSLSPTLRLLGRLVVLAVDTAQPPRQPTGTKSGKRDPGLEAIYARNIRTISAINRGRGVKTVWIGEIVDPVALATRGTDADPWAPFVDEEQAWMMLSDLNEVLRREAIALGDFYVDIPVGEFASSDFSDGEHFAASGSQKFARQIAPTVARACGP